MINTRLHWVDTLKGMGIILVVFAHYSLPVTLETYIYSFHMPLFFFISGFLFNFRKYEESAANFLRERLRSLIVPYFFFAALTGMFYLLLNSAYPPGSVAFFPKVYFLLDSVYSQGITNFEFLETNAFRSIYFLVYSPGSIIYYNPSLWFLPCLFVTELLFYGFAKKYYERPKKLVFLLIAAGLLGYIASVVIHYLYSVNVPFRLPWNADAALTAVVFYGAGNLFRNLTESKIESESSAISGANSRFREKFARAEKYFPGVLILLSLLYIGYLMEFPITNKINMNVIEYGNFFYFYLLAFLGIFTFVYTSKKIERSRILEYYGRNSLTVLALHFPIMSIQYLSIFLIFGIDLDADYYNPGIVLGLVVLNLILLVPLISLVNNYFPFLLGKKVIHRSQDKMREIVFDKKYKKYAFMGFFGITALSISIIGSIASADLYVYVTNMDDNTVSVIDANGYSVADTVDVGNSPEGAAVSPDGSKVYVVNNESSTVSVINTGLVGYNIVVATVPVGTHPSGIAVSQDGSKVYVANQDDNDVSVIDTATNNVSATVDVGSTPEGITISPDGSKVYVANQDDDTVSIIDTNTYNIAATADVGSSPYGIAINPEGSKVYVTNNDNNTVSVIDAIKNNITATIDVGSSPSGVAVSPDGSKVYVANQDDDTVSVINAATNTVTVTVHVGSTPEGITISPDGSIVYVANQDDDTVSVIDTKTYDIAATADVGSSPHGGAFGKMHIL